MKLRFRFVLCTLFLLFSTTAFSIENNNENKHEASQSAAHYRADLIELAQRIKKEHPRPFRTLSEQSFDQLVQSRVDEIDDTTTKRELLWHFSEILASIGCGHTQMPFFNQESQLISPQERFPLEVRFVDDKLIVIDPLNNHDKFVAGDVITSINGRPVSNLLQEIYGHISADMHFPFYKRHAFNVYATAFLTYELGFPAKYEVNMLGGERPVALKPLQSFTPKPVVHPQRPCQKRLCYRVVQDTDTAVLTLRSFEFYGNQINQFITFVDNAFRDLVEHERKTLIIDIRGNLGGSNLASSYVLRHLANKPFQFYASISDQRGNPELFQPQQPIRTDFTGSVYVLMDGQTVSSAPHFISLVKQNHFALLVGEPPGGNKSTNDGALRFESTHSDIEYKVARMIFEVEAPSLNPTEPVYPDISVPYTEQQLITGDDIMLQSLLEHTQAENE